jgi:hypothetical protein
MQQLLTVGIDGSLDACPMGCLQVDAGGRPPATAVFKRAAGQLLAALLS